MVGEASPFVGEEDSFLCEIVTQHLFYGWLARLRLEVELDENV
jgi:hypothetical protein